MTTTGQTHLAGAQQAQQARWRSRQSPQLTSMSEAARRALRGSLPIAQPMMSRAGIRAEARRVRQIMRAHMKDHQLTVGE